MQRFSFVGVGIAVVAQDSHKDSAKCVRIVPSADVEAREIFHAYNHIHIFCGSNTGLNTHAFPQKRAQYHVRVQP